MGISIASEARIFYLSILYGIAVAIIFDLFRAFRRLVKGSTTAVGVQDVAFWVILAAVVFTCIDRVNDGEPRWYIFAGILLGAVLYLLTLSKWLIKVFEKIFLIIYTVFKFLCKAVVFPLKLLKKPLKLFAVPLSRFKKMFIRRVSKVKFDIKKTKKILKMY